MLEHLLEKFGRRETCSITNIRNMCVTFIRNWRYLKYLEKTTADIYVLSPKLNLEEITIEEANLLLKIERTTNVKFYNVADPDYAFVIYHNKIYENTPAARPKIGKNCIIHPTVILDAYGLKVTHAPDGSRVQIIHVGNVVIGDDVEIGPYTVVHRATLDSTIIEKGVKIGAKNNIGHNNIIGQNTVFAAGAITNGSVTIGRDCWIGSGALIKNGISICDNVVIGMGAVVVKNITKPGIYAGCPAKYMKSIEEGWNF